MSILKSHLLVTFIALIINLLFGEIRCEEEQSILDFRSNPLGISEREGLFPVKLGNSTSNMRIMAYMYFNQDKYVDLACVESTNSGDRLVFFEYVYVTGTFEKNTSYSEELTFKGRVLNVHAVDLNRNNYFDLVVTYEASGSINHEVLIFDPLKYTFSSFKLKGISTTPDLSTILVADINGDGIIDILFYDNGAGEKKFATFNTTELTYTTFASLISSDTECAAFSASNSKNPLAANQASALIDIDGDCVNDLVLFTQDPKTKKTQMEIWKGWTSTNLAYCLYDSNLKVLPANVGPISFGDIDRDGYIDLIFSMNNENKVPTVSILFNQMKNSIDWSSDYCHERLADVKKKVVIFPDFKSDGPDVFKDQIFVRLDLGQNYEIYEDKTLNVHPMVRVGDINNDSFPDIILTFQDSVSKKRKVLVFLSQPYLKKFGNVVSDTIGEETDPPRRTFLYDSKTNDTSYTIDVSTDVIYASYFDLDENGQLDIIAVLQDKNSNFFIKGFYNNFNYDAFYLKGVTLYDKKHFTTPEVGTSYRYITTNLDGTRRMDTSFQLLSNSRLSLNLPFTLIGIGRSNNYIENFCVITTLFIPGKDTYKVFTPIIPNSQLIISTNYDRENKDFDWYLDLIVNPTSQLHILIITIACILIVNLAFIIYLHYKEVQEDKDSDTKVFALWYK